MSTCLTCLQSNSVQSIHSTHNSLKLPISEILTYCTTIKPESNDGQPNLICNNCIRTLAFMYQFKKKALASYEKMQSDPNNKPTVEECETVIITAEKPTKDKKVQLGDLIEEIYGVQPQVEQINETYHSMELSNLSNFENETTPEEKSAEIEQKQANNGEEILYEVDRSNLMEMPDLINHSDLQSDLDVQTLTFITTVEVDELNERKEADSYEQIILEVEQGDAPIDSELEAFDAALNNNASGRAELEDGDQLASEPPFRCTLCSKTFKSRLGFRRHETNHAGVRYQCLQCQQVYTSKTALKDHIDVIHDNVTRFQCAYCEKNFTRRTQLKSHERGHTDEARFACELCGSTFKFQSSYKYHLEKHASASAQEHTCDLCPACFNTQPELAQHLSQHAGAVNHTCTVCGKGYRYRTNLEAHMCMHTGERPHKCLTCKKGFVTLAYLNQHTVLRHNSL